MKHNLQNLNSALSKKREKIKFKNWLAAAQRSADFFFREY